MRLSSILLLCGLSLAPMASIQAADVAIPHEFEALFTNDEARASLDVEAVALQLGEMLAKSSLSENDQARLQEALMDVIIHAREGRMIEAWKAGVRLENLCAELKAAQSEGTRGIFDVIGAVFDLVQAVRDGDFFGVLKALWTIISSLID